MSLIIDSEFQALIPPLSDYEREQLEANIKAEGCRDPLVMWRGRLLDGHNRLDICERNAVAYTVVDIELPDREAAKDWIDRNQIGRRNLSPDNFRLLIGRIYNRTKKAVGKHEGNQYTERDQNDPLPKTADTLAEQYGVSAPTVKRAGKAAESVDDTPLSESVTRGEVRLTEATELASTMREQDPGNKDYTLEEAREAHNHRAQGTGQSEWYTPTKYIDAARDVLGEIELDPASNDAAQESINAGRYYTLEDDGLEQQWQGRVWLNPPYAQPSIMQFIEKLCLSYQRKSVPEAILLTHNYTDTRWFHLATQHASAICFTRGRIGFLNPAGQRAAPTQGQAFFYFGDDVQKFSDRFSDFGFIVSIFADQSEYAEAVA